MNVQQEKSFKKKLNAIKDDYLKSSDMIETLCDKELTPKFKNYIMCYLLSNVDVMIHVDTDIMKKIFGEDVYSKFVIEATQCFI